MEIYKHVLNMLDALYMDQNQNQTVPNTSYLNSYNTNQSILLDGMDNTKLGSTVCSFLMRAINTW